MASYAFKIPAWAEAITRIKIRPLELNYYNNRAGKGTELTYVSKNTMFLDDCRTVPLKRKLCSVRRKGIFL